MSATWNAKTKQAVRKYLAKRMGNVCHYCAVPLRDGAATLDHIWPESLGGPWSKHNLVLACRKCNHRFGAATHKCDCERCEAVTARYEIEERAS